MSLFSEFRTRPKVQNRSKRHFAKFLPPDFAFLAKEKGRDRFRERRGRDSFCLPDNEVCKLQIQHCQRSQDCHRCQGAN